MDGADGRRTPPSGNFPPQRGARHHRHRPPVYERPLGHQMGELYSSSPSVSTVSSDKSPPQMVAPPIQPPRPLDSPLQMVPSVQPSKSDSTNSSFTSEPVVSDSGAAPFDICMRENKCIFKLNRSLLEINREKRRREKELASNDAAKSHLHLRPGMLLLKNFLKHSDQARIIKLSRDLGVGAGGFYTPGYRDGAKLSLWMMCLGKNWEPGSCSYGDVRSYDGAHPPNIPNEFGKLVEDVIQDSHKFLKQNKGVANPMEELPSMSPDICIVNFYTSCGRLGLHKDKDESETSLRQGLPVVSFSLGDTAEFLYGDTRDPDKASKIDLESGDVLIFGGESRHVFHGVSCIRAKSAPSWLTDKTNLRPGRLNLTFRQY